MTPEQQKALAIARARRRRAEAQQSSASPIDAASTADPANELGIPVFNRALAPAEVDKMRFDREVDAEAQRRLAKDSMSPQWLQDSAAGGVRGFTGGLADKIVSAPIAGLKGLANIASGEQPDFSGQYAREVAVLQRMRDMQRERSPVASLAGELAGGVALGGKAAAQGVTLMRPGLGVGQQIARGTGEGAIYGSIYGSGEASLGNEATGAAQGATVGGIIGGAIPAAGALGKAAFDVADNALSPYLRPEQFAAKKVAQRLAQDGKSVAGMQARMAREPGLTVADLGGQNTRNLARTAANVPGSGQQKIISRVNVGQMGQGQRVTDVVDATIGSSTGWRQAAADIADRRANQAGPLYQRAFANKEPIDITPVLQELDTTIAPGISRTAAPNGGIPSGIAPDSVTGQLLQIRNRLQSQSGAMKTDMEQLHLLKMDLDDLISSAQRAGNRTLARKVGDVQRSLLRQMDAKSPDYQEARRIFASESRMNDALEQGYEFINRNVDITPADMARMSPSEREMFRLGVARGLKEAIDKAPDGADVVKRIYGSRAKRAALNIAFENAADRRMFEAAMLREARRSRTRAAVTGNSSTARQQSDIEDAGIDAGAIGQALSGNFLEAIRSLVGRAGARIGGVTPRVGSAIADLTMTRDPTSLADLMRRIQEAETRSGRLDTLYTRAQQIARPVPSVLTSRSSDQ